MSNGPDSLAALPGFRLSELALRRLQQYRDALAGAPFNLTSLRDREPQALERRHLAESLAFGQLLARRGLLTPGVRLLDLGAGAGLPGIPLKIAWPDIDLTLLESVGKKCRFLEDVVRRLGLEAKVVEARAEDAGRDPRYREAFDLVVARAVAPLPVLLEYSLPLLRVGGQLAAIKGSAALREVEDSGAALAALGGRLVDIDVFRAPGGMELRAVLVGKDFPTPERYPRRAGIPAKRPIQ
ncbi:MAG TPA: 16S rRNA (guanine(527)-N(7))-methyltransferase RsmG [Dehalococcoidia bacterium]|nr:16S rRNA (guanine(527)-N(7))-methyltransferase RsmG [Dehalococcoidia bacterium]